MKNVRIESIDIVRGIVMVFMALDHTRDFFGDHTIDALGVEHTTAPLFFSRWITHLCATSFVFLAGSSAFLQKQSADRPSSTWFLVSRGLILIFLEQTFLRCFGWYFNFDYSYMNANVLWGIGCAMILLGFASSLPRVAVLITGVVIIVFNDLLLQLISVGENQQGYWLWLMFFKGGNIEYLPSHNFYVSYPIVPWFGIMAVGYGLAIYFLADKKSGFRWHHAGLITLSMFVLLRAFFTYGNPTQWELHENGVRTILSFINLEKYPPSFLFTLLTLSCTFFMLAIAPVLPAVLKQILIVFGQVPLFFYITHIILIHSLAVVVAVIRYGHAEWLYNGPGIFWGETLSGHPPDYGLSLIWVYLITLAVLLALYPLCLRYRGKKRNHKSSVLRYF